MRCCKDRPPPAKTPPVQVPLQRLMVLRGQQRSSSCSKTWSRRAGRGTLQKRGLQSSSQIIRQRRGLQVTFCCAADTGIVVLWMSACVWCCLCLGQGADCHCKLHALLAAASMIMSILLGATIDDVRNLCSCPTRQQLCAAAVTAASGTASGTAQA